MIFIIRPIGVTTRKKTAPIAMGAKIAPKNIPNLNQSIFGGVNNLELVNPKNKNIKEIIIDQIIIDSAFVSGHSPKHKNTIKKVKPKFRFELILILDFFIISLNLFILYKSVYNIPFC